MKRILINILIVLSLVLIVAAVMLHTPDIPIDEMKERWAYDNSQFMMVDDLEVHYRVNGEGPAVVLLHGTASSLHTWEEWTKALEQNYKVISLDLPAFGLTGPNSTGDYSLSYYAKFLDSFVSQLGVDSFHLAGNSLGGSIAWTYAAMYPNKLDKLILIDAGGYPSETEKSPTLAFRLARNPVLSNILLNMTPRSLLESSLKEVYHNDDVISNELIDRYYDMTLREGNRQAFVDRVNGLRYNDPSSIKTIKNPTLILWGKTDEWIPVKNAYNFEEDIEGAEVVIYDNAGHVPMEEIPEETVADVIAFLEKPLEVSYDSKVDNSLGKKTKG